MKFLRRRTRKRRSGAVPVHLNVYDLTPFNGYAYWFGLGIYHSGVQVHGVEYAYGAHEHPTTGIFEGEPRQCPGFAFRKSILIGRTDLGPREVRALMEEMAAEYTGITYNLITKNCNHFCNEACHRLTGKAIPRWVNRLAKIGFLCNCVLPVQVAAVRQPAATGVTGGGDGERRRLRSNSTKFPPPPNAAPPHPSSSNKPPSVNLPAAAAATASPRSTGSRRNRRSSSHSSVGGAPTAPAPP
ncbi:deSI-like protein [Canna indica]|uniref:DeSI-like protein n=1 Tax=Canna indica TaxID=4628 RepID=A0AAQ3KDC7_9LILI|nr:deSI-like protein [Canna indica]